MVESPSASGAACPLGWVAGRTVSVPPQPARLIAGKVSARRVATSVIAAHCPQRAWWRSGIFGAYSARSCGPLTSQRSCSVRVGYDHPARSAVDLGVCEDVALVQINDSAADLIGGPSDSFGRAR